jgi:hypothetical protein
MNYKNFCINLVKLSSALIFTFFLISCGEKKSSYIFVIDMSKSVSSEARAQAFEAVRSHSRTLKRGDSITIIPLNGDAAVDTGGKVVRQEVRETVLAYDDQTQNHIKEFMTELEKNLAQLEVSGKISNQTDLFGALRVANDEISMLDAKKRRIVLIVISDMIHSTQEIRFEKDSLFLTPESARKFAENKVQNWENIEVYCGSAESSDLRAMAKERREAVRAFWEEFFHLGKAKRFQYTLDGAGQFPKFINGKDSP